MSVNKIGNIQGSQSNLRMSERYQLKYLQEQYRNSQQFLDDCSFDVKLDQLYQILSTPTYNISMQYVPVQLEVLDTIREYYGGKKYLVQVWDNKGFKMFEKSLDSQVSQWAICYHYFIFKINDRNDPDSEYFQVVDLNRIEDGKATILKIKDFVKDPSYQYLCFNNECFYVGNHNEIKVVKADLGLIGDGKQEILEFDELKDVVRVPLDSNKLHGFFLNTDTFMEGNILTWLETADASVVPVELKVFNLPQTKITNVQIDGKSKMPATVNRTKTSNTASLNESQKLSQASSKTFDYQFNDFRFYKPRNLKDDPVVKFQYILQQDQTTFAIALRKSGQFDLYYDGTIIDSPQNVIATDINISFDTFYILFGQKETTAIKMELKNRAVFENGDKMTNFVFEYIIFENIKMHCRLIAGFTLIETTLFVAHGPIVTILKLNTSEFEIVKHLKFEYDVVEIYRKNNPGIAFHHLGVILQNGDIYVLSTETPKDTMSWDIDQNVNFDLPGHLFLMLARDFRSDQFPLFLSYSHGKDKTSLCTAYGATQFDLTKQVVPLKIDYKVIGLYEAWNATYFCIITHDEVYVYTIDFIEEKNDVIVTQKYKFLLDSASKNVNFYGGLIDDKHLTLISNKDAFKFEIDDNDPLPDRIIRDIRWQGFLVTDDLKYCFSLNKKHIDRGVSSGLKYYDMEYFRNVEDGSTFQDKSYHLKSTQVGIQSFIDYSKLSQRIVYLANYQQIKIIPTIKNNTLNLMGQEDYDSYIAIKQDYDRFYALSKNNILSTWNILTAKKIVQDYSLLSEQNTIKHREKMNKIRRIQSNTPSANPLSSAKTADGDKNQSSSSGPYISDHKTNDQSVVNSNVRKASTYNDETANVSQIQSQSIDMLDPVNDEVDMGDDKQDYSDYRTFCDDDTPHLYKDGLHDKILIMCNTPVSKHIDDEEFFDANMIKSRLKNHMTWHQSLSKSYRRFKLIEIMDECTVHQHLSFIWPYFEGKTQLIYFSKDCNYMFQQIQNKLVYLYARVPGCPDYDVKWQVIRSFQNYPDQIQVDSYQAILSPNYVFYIDVDLKTKCFQIKQSMTEQLYATIPRYLLNYDGKYMDEDGQMQQKTPQYCFNRFCWIDESKFVVISDDFIAKIVNISEEVQGGARVVKFNQSESFTISNFDREQLINNHFRFKTKKMNLNETTKRLMWKSERYHFMRNSCKVIMGLTHEDGLPYQHKMNRQLFNIDFQNSFEIKRFFSDLSFTYLNWRIIEMLQDDQINVNEIDPDIIQQVIFNILPNGSNFTHYLSSNAKAMENFYQRSLKKQEKGGDDDDSVKETEVVALEKTSTTTDYTNLTENLEYVINIQENFNGVSVFDIHVEQEDMISMNMHLKYLKYFPLGHHSKLLSKVLPEIFEAELPNLVDYIKSRVFSTNQIEKITKATMNELESGGTIPSYLLDSDETINKLFKKSAKDVQVKLQFIDLSDVHRFDLELCENYFNALGESDQLDIFELEPIKRQIDFMWPLSESTIIWKLFGPYVVMLLVYQIYYDSKIMGPDAPEDSIPMQVCMWTYMVLGTYFLLIEIYQVSGAGFEYFSEFWNYLDFLPPVLFWVTYLLDLLVDDKTENYYVWTSILISINNFFLYFKVLYFMRIFQSTGFYIKLILDTTGDMKYFLLIFIILQVAFANVYFRVSQIYPEDEQFIENVFYGFLFTYRQSIGEWDLELFEINPTIKVYLYSMFFLSTMVNMIIMLNILIAIVSDTYAEVMEKASQASLKERAKLIADNIFLMSSSVKENYCKDQQLLLFIKGNQSTEEKEEKDDD